VTKQYTILSAAGGVSGTFGSLVNSNLSPMFKASLTSDANDVFLDVSAISPGGGGSGGNGSSGNGSGLSEKSIQLSLHFDPVRTHPHQM
jgi:hypothetical protein